MNDKGGDMAQIPFNRKLDVINLYIKDLPKQEISARANVSQGVVDFIVKEFLEAAKRMFDLEQKTGKTCDEIITEVKELSQQREKFIGDLTDMECM